MKKPDASGTTPIAPHAQAVMSLIRITVANRGPEAAVVHLLPTLWFRNTWSWGGGYERNWLALIWP